MVSPPFFIITVAIAGVLVLLLLSKVTQMHFCQQANKNATWKQVLRSPRVRSSSSCSFTLILRTVDDCYPIALLALMDTLAAPLIVLAPPNVIYEICPFLFFLFPQSGHRYHLLFYCSDLVRFFKIFADISEEIR